MLDIKELLQHALTQHASDVFIIAGRELAFSIFGEIMNINEKILEPEDTKTLIESIYEISERDFEIVHHEKNDDFSFALKGVARFRVNAYIQRGSYAAVIRIISFELPKPEVLNIPQSILDLGNRKKGLVLVTGTAGSGKSTTLACIIDQINSTQNKHIITLEDPLEFLHRHKKSIMSQREINTDVHDYLSALRAALRQRPDVILLGEMRDFETIDVAMTAAETGHLIFSSLHTVGAANTIERIIDVFPANQQRQIAVQLAMVLSAVVSQQLVPDINGKLIPVLEIMNVNPAIKNLIRENKIHQIDNVISLSQSEEMISMDSALIKLYKEGRITKQTVLSYSTNPEAIAKKV
ncbi:MAG: type IV pilus twitching motility protein PilT [Lachnospiraceae bacterium]